MTIGVAVIGAGMAGRAHAAAYRIAPTLYESILPDLRFVSIGDVSPGLGSLAARRFGYERNDTSWQAIAEDPDINVLSVVVANFLHRQMVEGLVAAGKHVLCEKPLSDNLEDARAMADLARSANTVVRIGFTFRRAPGVAALRELVTSGALGRILHVDGRYWCDYASDPMGPMSWRYKGAPGSGALADIGSHVAYLVEFLGGDVQEVSGGRFATAITERPVPLGTVVGHGQAAVSDTYEAVENDDYASFSAQLERSVGVVQVSRVAAGHPNGLALEVFGDNGAAKWEQERPAEFQLMLHEGAVGTRGYRRVIIGPDHPYFAGGLPMDAPGVGVGQNDGFVFQARAFLEEVAGIDEADALPRNASFDEGVHNSGDSRGGRRVRRRRRRRGESSTTASGGCAMKFGVYNAILHDRSLPEAIEVIAKLGLTGIELNSGGFLPPVHIPTFDDILSSDAARDDFLGLFEGTGVEIAGLNCNGNPLHPDPVIGSKHSDDVRRSIRLANRLGQHRVVTMSGLPAGEPGGRRPNWIVNAWNSAGLDVLDYQWRVAEDFWREIDREAADLDVKVALELHPQNLVFNPAGIRELVQRTRATHIGVELDASHLFWQWMDPVAVVQDLGPLVIHAAAKDVRINTSAAVYGVLDNRFRRLGPEEPRINLGGDEWANEWPKNAAWDFVALGRGHDAVYWSTWLAALRVVDPDMLVNIEHEDVTLGRIEGLEVAAAVLLDAARRAGIPISKAADPAS